jgi:hypothetical protein
MQAYANSFGSALMRGELLVVPQEDCQRRLCWNARQSGVTLSQPIVVPVSRISALLRRHAGWYDNLQAKHLLHTCDQGMLRLWMHVA